MQYTETDTLTSEGTSDRDKTLGESTAIDKGRLLAFIVRMSIHSIINLLALSVGNINCIFA